MQNPAILINYGDYSGISSLIEPYVRDCTQKITFRDRYYSINLFVKSFYNSYLSDLRFHNKLQDLNKLNISLFEVYILLHLIQGFPLTRPFLSLIMNTLCRDY